MSFASNIENSRTNSPLGLVSNPLSLPMKILISIVSAVAIFALGSLVASFLGIGLGAAASLTLGFSAIAILTNTTDQEIRPQDLDHQQTTVDASANEVSEIGSMIPQDPQALQQQAAELIKLYNALPILAKPIFQGSIIDQAEQMRNWMKESQEVQNCEILDLSNLGFVQWPPEICLFRNLRNLDLSYNQLQILPIEIRNLEALEELNLSHNQLRTLPAEIGFLQALEKLILSSNQLRTLPPQIGNLRALKWLGFSNNLLLELPAEIGNLEDLEVLNLGNNPFLIAFPDFIMNLPNVTIYI